MSITPSAQELKAALDAVRQQYEGTAQWLKAPNGKPTKLNERQWLQVRTPQFKAWFGDWQAAIGVKKLHDAKPLQLGELLPLADKKAVEGAFRGFKDVTNAYDKRSVAFPVSTAGKIVRHKGFDVRRIAGAFDRLFAQAVPMYAELEQARDGHKSHVRNIAAYHHYVNKFEQGGATYFVRFTVQQMRAKPGTVGDSLLHSSFVSDIAVYEQGKGVAPDSASVWEDAPVLAEDATPLDEILAQWLQSGNPESVSKVLDENGEPQVVYHGTEAAFSVFDEQFMGKTGTADGQGFYFTDDVNYAQGFAEAGGKVMPMFLNIRRALDGDKRSITKAQARKILAEVDALQMEDGEHYFLSNYGDVRSDGFNSVLNEAVQMEWGDADSDVAFVGSLVNGSASLKVVHTVLGKVLGDAGVIAHKKDGSTHFVVGLSNLAKSATDNTGAFDGNNGDVYHQSAPQERSFAVAARALSLPQEGVGKEQAAKKLAQLRGKDLRNDSTGIVARVNVRQAGKLLSNAAVDKSMGNGFTREQHYAAAANVQELWRYAVLAENRADRAGDENIASIKRFVAPVFFDGDVHFAALLAKESQEHGHRVYSVEVHELKTLQGMLDELAASANTSTDVEQAPAWSVDSILGQFQGVVKSHAEQLNQTTRGSFNPTTLNISLLANADSSTFLHETGHFFLEMRFDMAARMQAAGDPDAPGAVKLARDTQVVLDWFGLRSLDEWFGLSFDLTMPCLAKGSHVTDICFIFLKLFS